MNRNSGKFVLSHILKFMPKHEFDQCVLRYDGNYRTQSFSSYDQFLCMAFAQLTFRESLRDYALDSSVIDLCLSTFPWAKYKTTKSAIKLHTSLDLRGNIPSFIVITDGKRSDPSNDG